MFDDLIRSARSGRDWNDYDLIAYNITISSLPPADFFPTPDPSLDHIDPAILDSPLGNTDPAISDAAAEYIAHLTLAYRDTREFIDFTTETLRLLGFDEGQTVISTNHIIPFTICGKSDSDARTDLSLLHAHTNSVLLVLVTDKPLMNLENAEAQIVASAIAAFQFNNDERRDRNLAPLDCMTIPCIRMVDTCPIFYLVPVTTALSDAVIAGRPPSTQTRVLQCPTVARFDVGIGMENTEFRKLALRHFLAFKALAKSHWIQVSEVV